MALRLKLFFVATLVGGCLGEASMTHAVLAASSNTPATTAKPSTTPATTAKPSTAPATTAKPSTAPPTTTETGSPPTTTETGSPPTTTETGSPPTTAETGSPPTTAETGSPPTTAETGSPPPSTTVPPTTETPNACSSSPCKDGSKCESRADQTYVCMCLTGDYYNYASKTCLPAKVFPGEVATTETEYEESLKEPTSALFLQLSMETIKMIETRFTPKDDYKNSTVLAFSEKKQRKSFIVASVLISFSEKSHMTKEKLTDAFPEGVFTGSPLCESQPGPCDAQTTTCEEKEGLVNCTCLPGYILSSFTNRACTSCPIGEHPDKSGNCQFCDFGYSGFDCRESWKLTLVIVGSVLGGLLLITIILLPIVAKKSSKKSSKKNKMLENGKPSMSQKSLAPPPMVHSGFAESRPVSAQGGSSNGLATFANAGVPRIPRATTTSGWDRSSNLEMTPSHSRQNLIPGGRNMHTYDDPDDTNANAYTRPQSNPYAQNRPTFNPYGQSRGQSNPYFASDVGRRY